MSRLPGDAATHTADISLRIRHINKNLREYAGEFCEEGSPGTELRTSVEPVKLWHTKEPPELWQQRDAEGTANSYPDLQLIKNNP